jgi:cell division protease FtsH
MGGRAAEQGTGALSDLKSHKTSSRNGNRITLNDKIGNVTYYDSTGQSEYNFAKPYSEETAKSLILKFHY